MEILYDDEYVRLVDAGNFYILEDKVKMACASAGREMLDEGGELIFLDTVITPEGNIGVSKYFVQKSGNPAIDEQGKQIFLQKAHSLSQKYRRGWR
jgi:hypothetical protein